MNKTPTRAHSKQTGSLLPYLMLSIICCFAIGQLCLYLLAKFDIEAVWWVKVLVYLGPLLFFLFAEDLFEMVVHWIRIKIFKKKYFCPCCGYRTLNRKSPGSSDICNLCGWEDNYWQSTSVDREEGPNALTLRQCQYKFIEELEASGKKPEEDRYELWFKIPPKD